MPRSKSIPTYRYHVSGQAIVTFCQKNFYLGPHNSQGSFARYNALVAEYIANGMVAPPGETRLADKPLTAASIKQNRAARVHMGGGPLCALNHATGAFYMHPRGGFYRGAF